MVGLCGLIDRVEGGEEKQQPEQRNEVMKEKQQVSHSSEYEGFHIWQLCNWMVVGGGEGGGGGGVGGGSQMRSNLLFLCKHVLFFSPLSLTLSLFVSHFCLQCCSKLAL